MPTTLSDRLEGVGVVVYIDTATASDVLGRGCEELARKTRLAPDTGERSVVAKRRLDSGSDVIRVLGVFVLFSK